MALGLAVCFRPFYFPFLIFIYHLTSAKSHFNLTDVGTCQCSFLIHIYFMYVCMYVYVFMAVWGLCFCARAFSSCGKRRPLFIAVHGPLTITASPVAEHRQAPDAQAQ